MTAKIVRIAPEVSVDEEKTKPNFFEEVRRLLLQMGRFVKVAGDFEGQS